MSQVAAAGFAPFLSAADPKLLGMESYSELSKPRDLEKIFLDETEQWRSFRDSDDSVCCSDDAKISFEVTVRKEHESRR